MFVKSCLENVKWKLINWNNFEIYCLSLIFDEKKIKIEFSFFLCVFYYQKSHYFVEYLGDSSWAGFGIFLEILTKKFSMFFFSKIFSWPQFLIKVSFLIRNLLLFYHLLGGRIIAKIQFLNQVIYVFRSHRSFRDGLLDSHFSSSLHKWLRKMSFSSKYSGEKLISHTL